MKTYRVAVTRGRDHEITQEEHDYFRDFLLWTAEKHPDGRVDMPWFPWALWALFAWMMGWLS